MPFEETLSKKPKSLLNQSFESRLLTNLISVFDETLSKKPKSLLNQSFEMASPMVIDLGTGIDEYDNGVKIVYRHRLERGLAECQRFPAEKIWSYYQVPVEIDSCIDEPEEPNEQKQYSLVGADENGIYHEWLGWNNIPEDWQQKILNWRP